jgi:hypothetical protein
MRQQQFQAEQAARQAANEATAAILTEASTTRAPQIRGADIKELPKIGEDSLTAVTAAERLTRILDWIHESGALVAAMFPTENVGTSFWKQSVDHSIEQHLVYCAASRACQSWSYSSRAIPSDELAIEARVRPLLLAALPKTLRARAISFDQDSTIQSDQLVHMLLVQAYRGTSKERSELSDAICDVKSVKAGQDAEVLIEQWRRLVSYLPRFGIAMPDYGKMIAAVNRIIAPYESDPKFALDRALYAREKGIDSIRHDDRETFDAYVIYLQGLLRVAGAHVPKGDPRTSAKAAWKGFSKDNKKGKDNGKDAKGSAI